MLGQVWGKLTPTRFTTMGEGYWMLRGMITGCFTTHHYTVQSSEKPRAPPEQPDGYAAGTNVEQSSYAKIRGSTHYIRETLNVMALSVINQYSGRSTRALEQTRPLLSMNDFQT